MLTQEVLEDRGAGARGVDGLRDLRELQRIAQEHQIARARADRQGVRQRDLTGLVDEQVVQRAVQLGASEPPRIRRAGAHRQLSQAVRSAVGPAHTFKALADAINQAFARWDLVHLHEFSLTRQELAVDRGC